MSNPIAIQIKQYPSTNLAMNEDGEFLCTHEEAYIEKACCSGMQGGLPSCGCNGQDGIICPAWDCTDIQTREIDGLFDLLESEEPDWNHDDE